MTNRVTKTLKWTGLFVALLALFLPSILQGLGLHPEYHGPTYQLPGKRALVITTSNAVLSSAGETEGKPTGVMASEMTPTLIKGFRVHDVLSWDFYVSVMVCSAFCVVYI